MHEGVGGRIEWRILLLAALLCGHVMVVASVRQSTRSRTQNPVTVSGRLTGFCHDLEKKLSQKKLMAGRWAVSEACSMIKNGVELVSEFPSILVSALPKDGADVVSTNHVMMMMGSLLLFMGASGASLVFIYLPGAMLGVWLVNPLIGYLQETPKFTHLHVKAVQWLGGSCIGCLIVSRLKSIVGAVLNLLAAVLLFCYIYAYFGVFDSVPTQLFPLLLLISWLCCGAAVTVVVESKLLKNFVTLLLGSCLFLSGAEVLGWKQVTSVCLFTLVVHNQLGKPKTLPKKKIE